jgi:hypothetical protein
VNLPKTSCKRGLLEGKVTSIIDEYAMSRFGVVGTGVDDHVADD